MEQQPLCNAIHDEEEKLLPDFEDNADDVLVSFSDLKRKTTDTLYTVDDEDGDANSTSLPTNRKKKHGRKKKVVDKSPKGSIDEPIRDLVDLINRHPSFTTLSSCSGRLSLFDPQYHCMAALGATLTSTTSAATAVEILDKDAIDPNAPNQENRISQVLETPYDCEYLPSSTSPAQAGASGSNSNDIQAKDIQALAGESGKGRGGNWVFVSHEEANTSTFLEMFFSHHKHQQQTQDDDSSTSTSTMIFKFEPMLLHVAASTHSRGRQLLTLALRLGFRESGLVISNNRVTVAIRGHSLSLAVPLACHGPLRPTGVYLSALVDEANQRLRANFKKLARLTCEIKQCLFSRCLPKLSDSSSKQQKSTVDHDDASARSSSMVSSQSVNISCQQQLPDLNLWGHAIVAVPFRHEHQNRKTNDCDILVFGGYGKGPDLIKQNDEENYSEGNKNHCRRSGEIFCLKRRDDRWMDHWEQVEPRKIPWENKKGSEKTTTDQPGNLQQEQQGTTEKNVHMMKLGSSLNGGKDLSIQVSVASRISPREGVAACLFPIIQHQDQAKRQECDPEPKPSLSSPLSIIGVWGGRQGPSKPFGELLICQYHHPKQDYASKKEEASSCLIGKPVDIRGEHPSPRWGHTMTALSLQNNNIDFGSIHLAVIVGGRTDHEEEKCFNSIHILSIVKIDDESGSSSLIKTHFLWEMISCGASLPFHHCTVVVDDDESDESTIFIFGGLSLSGGGGKSNDDGATNDLLQCFATSNSKSAVIEHGRNRTHFSKCSEGNHSRHKDDTHDISIETYGSFKIMQKKVCVKSVKSNLSSSNLLGFGASSCVLELDSNEDTKTMRGQLPQERQVAVLISGGIPNSIHSPLSSSSSPPSSSCHKQHHPFHCIFMSRGRDNYTDNSELAWRLHQIPSKSTMVSEEVSISGCVDDKLGKMMVHHCCAVVPSSFDFDRGSASFGNNTRKMTTEAVIIGGGVMGFAFDPCFSRSHAIKISCLSSVSVTNGETIQPVRNRGDESKVEGSEVVGSTGDSVTIDEDIRRRAINSYSSARKSNNVAPQFKPDVHRNDASTMTDVLYVNKLDAKSLKTRLEQLSFFDKTRRMAKSVSVEERHEEKKTTLPFVITTETLASKGGEQHIPAISNLPRVDSDHKDAEIAVPITKSCLTTLQEYYHMKQSLSLSGVQDRSYDLSQHHDINWISLVKGIGQQEMPYSTSQFARGRQKKR